MSFDVFYHHVVIFYSTMSDQLNNSVKKEKEVMTLYNPQCDFIFHSVTLYNHIVEKRKRGHSVTLYDPQCDYVFHSIRSWPPNLQVVLIHRINRAPKKLSLLPISQTLVVFFLFSESKLDKSPSAQVLGHIPLLLREVFVSFCWERGF